MTDKELMMELMQFFEDNTNHTFDTKTRLHSIDCKKGLWGVSGRNEVTVQREAMHYFMQYLEDGEYDKKEDLEPKRNTNTVFNIYRRGIIDGVETQQLLHASDQLPIWSEYPKWLPVLKSNLMGNFLVETITGSSLPQLHVCVYTYTGFRLYNKRSIVLNNVTRWKYV